MLKFFVVLTFCCLVPMVMGDISDFVLVGSSGSGAPMSYTVGHSEIVKVPALTDFNIRAVPPPSAQYTVTVTFVRGCDGVDGFVTGQTKFEDLNCVYDRDGFVGCYEGESIDAFFTPGQTVYFASEVQLSTQLTVGNRVTASLPIASIVTSELVCDGMTAQENAIHLMNQYNLNRNYGALATLMAPDVIMSVNAYAQEYIGIPIVVAYYALGDPDISDTFELMSSVITSRGSSGNIAWQGNFQTIRSLHLPEGQNTFQDNHIWEVRFNQYNLMSHIYYRVNTALTFAYFPQVAAPNITELCDHIMNVCTEEWQVYDSHESCDDFMHSIPLILGPFAQSVGTNDAGCRAFHSVLATTLPSVHCIHASPWMSFLPDGNVNFVDTPCIDATGPFTPVPPEFGTVAARHEEESGDPHLVNACPTLDDPKCYYGYVGDHGDSAQYASIAMQQRILSFIPNAGALIEECITSNLC